MCAGQSEGAYALAVRQQSSRGAERKGDGYSYRTADTVVILLGRVKGEV